MEKVLILHNYYRQRGGEDAVAEMHYQLLQRRGAEQGISVHFETVKSTDHSGVLEKAKIAFQVNQSQRAREWFNSTLDKVRPQWVHVHNFFPLITPEVFRLAKAKGCSTVMTVHNYRMFCANAQFFRENRACTACLEGPPAQALKYRCYHHSFFQTLALYPFLKNTTASLESKTAPWWKWVDKFLVFTPFMQTLLEKGGIPSEKIFVVPNFLPNRSNENGGRVETSQGSTKKENGGSGEPLRLLFVGRISKEKGLLTALSELQKFGESGALTLKVVGDGPEAKALQTKYPETNWLHWAGPKTSEAVENFMRSSDFLIVPSLWFEGMPLVILEAFRAGLPVIAHQIGNLQVLVEPEKTGYLVNPSQSPERAWNWVEVMEKIFSTKQTGTFERLHENRRLSAQQEFLKWYSEDRFLENIKAIYKN